MTAIDALGYGLPVQAANRKKLKVYAGDIWERDAALTTYIAAHPGGLDGKFTIDKMT